MCFSCFPLACNLELVSSSCKTGAPSMSLGFFSKAGPVAFYLKKCRSNRIPVRSKIIPSIDRSDRAGRRIALK
jgi:hypothetical protein